VSEVAASERRLALIGVFLCMFLSALDQTIVATALPRVVQDLGGTNLYAWVATSYLLASTVSLPIAGRLADMVAPKWILLVAASVFLVGSALSGLSTSMGALIVFRGIQGLGGGAIFAVAFTLVGLLFPPRERGRIQGLFGAVFGIASVVGPYLGGVLTDSFSWRYVFYVNMPFGALALYFLIAHMPTMAPSRRGKFDAWGVVTMLLWTVPMLLALSWGGSTYAWTSPVILGLFALTLAALIAFYLVQTRTRSPLFDLSLLKLPTFSWAGIGGLFFGAAFLGSILFLPLYLVEAKGVLPSSAGLVLTPLTLGVVAGSFAGGQLASRLGRYKGLLLTSNVLAAVAFFFIFQILNTTTPMSHLVLLMIVLGIGLGPSLPLYGLAVQNAVRREQMGIASSGNQFLRQIGSSIGAALMGALLVATMKTQITNHLPASYRTAAGSTSSFNSANLQSRSQTEHQIYAGFVTINHQLTAALEGSTAAYQAITTNPQVPASYRKQLVAGGIPAEVAAQTSATIATLTAAVHGNAAAQAKIAADATLPASLRGLAAHPPATPAAQTAAIRAVRKALVAAEPKIVKATEAKVIPPIQARVLAAGRSTARTVMAAITYGVTAGVREVFGLAGLLTLAALACGLFLPSVELRRSHAPEGMGGEVPMVPAEAP